MKKNSLAIVAIIVSVFAIVFAWPRKDVEINSLTLQDREGKVFAIFNAEHGQFTIYDPNGKGAVDIQTTNDGTNVIVRGKDGFERIRLSTWSSEGSYISILRDGWQNSTSGPPYQVHISKEGVKINK